MRAPYINKDGFRFKIYRRGLFSELGKTLGTQDVEIGHQEFDHDFIIQANDAEKVRSLCAHPTIRELIQAQPDIQLEVRDDEGWVGTVFPEGVDELSLQVNGDIRDVARLKLLYELFAATINHLCHTGSAYEDDPRLAL